jgi:hypothetical protein
MKKKNRQSQQDVAAEKARHLKTRQELGLQTISQKWKGQPAIVAATGPSLTIEVAEACRGFNAIVVNDAYRLMPWADMLYACDELWWRTHKGCPEFHGEKWSSHGAIGTSKNNDKTRAAQQFGLNLIEGHCDIGFSLDPEIIHYGSNSGFQAVNIAIHTGADPIILVGFNMQPVKNKRHFFGDHPAGLRNAGDYRSFATHFERAAKRLPKDITILNATPHSALTCFPKVDLHDALESHAAKRCGSRSVAAAA